jgi:lipopolysaccharide transport system ATP-binding protein
LSRITEPTTGRILLRGRVASLLEVGTGFHPCNESGRNTPRELVFLRRCYAPAGRRCRRPRPIFCWFESLAGRA